MSDIDVLLVRPWAETAVPSDALVEDSLGVGYLTSALRKSGFVVAVLDAFTLSFDDEHIVKCILELKPRLLGISLHSFADYRHAIAIADGVRQRLPDLYCVLGGEHATFLAREILERHHAIDAIILGEGEQSMIELVRRVCEQERFPLVSGAMTRSVDGRIQDGGFRPAVEDLDRLPRPSKDIVELAISLGRPVALSLLTGRGCTHKCTFCTANTFLRLGGGAVWRRRQPSGVVDEMEDLVQRYSGHNVVHSMIQFQDVIFLGTSPAARAWTADFVGELERRQLNIPYYIMSRAEAVLANAELLPRLAQSGLTSVEIGIESGIDRILQAYSKMNSAAHMEEAINLLRFYNICYDASGFIMFDPRISLDELRRNAGFLHRLGHATWDRYVTRLQVFPGTIIKQQLLNEGLSIDDETLDNVYAYRFLDPRVANVAEHAFMYDGVIHALDNAIHSARAHISQLHRRKEEHIALSSGVALAEDVYRDHFLRLVDLAEQEALEERFEHLIKRLLTQAALLTRYLHNTVIDARRAA